MGWILFISWVLTAKQQQPCSCSIPVTCGEENSFHQKIPLEFQEEFAGPAIYPPWEWREPSASVASLFSKGEKVLIPALREEMCFIPPSEGAAPCASTPHPHLEFALKRFLQACSFPSFIYKLCPARAFRVLETHLGNNSPRIQLLHVLCLHYLPLTPACAGCGDLNLGCEGQ